MPVTLNRKTEAMMDALLGMAGGDVDRLLKAWHASGGDVGRTIEAIRHPSLPSPPESEHESREGDADHE